MFFSLDLKFAYLRIFLLAATVHWRSERRIDDMTSLSDLIRLYLPSLGAISGVLTTSKVSTGTSETSIFLP